MTTSTGSAPLEGLTDSARAFGKTLSDLIQVRLELASLEFCEQRDIAKQEMILIAIAAIFCHCALLLTAGLVMLFFWDTHRLLATFLVTLSCISIGGWALLRIKEQRRNRPLPFAATIAELKQDLLHLRGLHDTGERD